MPATSVAPDAGTQAGDTTIVRAFDRYHLAIKLRMVRDTLASLEAVRCTDQHLLIWYKAQLSELRALIDLAQ